MKYDMYKITLLIGLALSSIVSTPIKASTNHINGQEITASLQGTYLDPHHPDGYRVITLVSTTRFIITGKDQPADEPWHVTGQILDGQLLVINFSAKGGPANITARVANNSIVFNDGNIWKKISEKEQSHNTTKPIPQS